MGRIKTVNENLSLFTSYEETKIKDKLKEASQLEKKITGKSRTILSSILENTAQQGTFTDVHFYDEKITELRELSTKIQKKIDRQIKTHTNCPLKLNEWIEDEADKKVYSKVQSYLEKSFQNKVENTIELLNDVNECIKKLETQSAVISWNNHLQGAMTLSKKGTHSYIASANDPSIKISRAEIIHISNELLKKTHIIIKSILSSKDFSPEKLEEISDLQEKERELIQNTQKFVEISNSRSILKKFLDNLKNIFNSSFVSNFSFINMISKKIKFHDELDLFNVSAKVANRLEMQVKNFKNTTVK